MSWPVETSAEAGTTNSPGSLAEQDKLFVFGYECKIFRDDEKADWIDKEKHLIPWMGDTSVLIDRYDGRGALTDLRSSDPQAAGVAADNIEEEDDSVEILCEEERYKDLHEDKEYDESAYQEEEFKRLQLAVSGMGVGGTGLAKLDSPYSAIGYSYDGNNCLSIGPEPKKFNEDLPYVQPSGLYVPPDIKLPTTMKSHAIIEKTAKFIAEQGNQMEIILKTKQASNQQFDFLGYNDELNPYYKYLVLVIKTGEYKPAEVANEDDSPSADNNDYSGSEEDCDTSYLHPSLVKKVAGSVPNVSKVIYKPTTTNSTYSILVSKIKGATPQEQQKSHSSTEPQKVQKEETNNVALTKVTTSTGVPVRQPHEMPTAQDQLIIEKMANYVVKNGSAFEGLAKTKGDPRFTFLDPQHSFHWYYLNCKERFKAEHNAVVASGSFMSYSKSEGRKKTADIASNNSTGPGPGHTTALPLSAAGIPIANHASIQNRPTTMSAELVSRIEEIRKKNALFSKSKDKSSESNPGALPCDNSISISSAFSLASATAQRILKRETKEKPIIKFSASLSHQTAITNDLKDRDELSSNSDSGKSSKSHSSRSCSRHKKHSRSSKHKSKKIDKNGTVEVAISEEEADRKRKEERRKKAALFLEKIKSSAIATQMAAMEVEKDEPGEIHSDVESVPSPNRPPDNISETYKENKHERLSGDIEVLERLKLPPDSYDINNGANLNCNPHKRRSGKRSLSTSSVESSYSDIHPPSSSSSSSKKKHSKRKHSKKRKKKHEKSKEKSRRSHSKKSKRHRR